VFQELRQLSRASSLIVLGAAVFLTASTYSAAQDWPQWRGPNRDGIVTAFVAPKSWPQALKPAWKMQVGEGHSSRLLLRAESISTLESRIRRSSRAMIYGLERSCGRTRMRRPIK
jgi:hypothetical protein